ncbi:SDR family NAD(P)-dependent oxidoreductase [Amycolatopsis jejuensis]|uniref:SDR family NAD(P)-dependent oxidoreductase n=1 Tax=Amycolatopsis jejuensis TaxID=330084 RepID=UPI0005241775|nr:SDR family NAD(P)-dependent oxidoreductase [Amycolatopsis jejuensis]
MAQLDFAGQVAIVTGGGRNLGRGYSLELARRGAAVVVDDIDGEAAASVAGEIERAGGKAVASAESVATAEGGAAIVAKAVEEFGTVDILVNNAGNLRAGEFAGLTLDDFEAVLAVHLGGAFCVTQPAWAVMRERGRGRIVMSGSAAGVYPEGGYSDYATAKAGIVGLTRALAAEGRAHGIHVNAILPQAGGSSMTADAAPIHSLEDARFRGPDAALAPYKSVEAVSPLVMYLCSPECSHTGLILSAGAGWFGRVFLGLTYGWTAPEPGVPPTAEEVARHFDRIVDPAEYLVPGGASDELQHIAARLGLATTEERRAG